MVNALETHISLRVSPKVSLLILARYKKRLEGLRCDYCAIVKAIIRLLDTITSSYAGIQRANV